MLKHVLIIIIFLISISGCDQPNSTPSAMDDNNKPNEVATEETQQQKPRQSRQNNNSNISTVIEDIGNTVKLTHSLGTIEVTKNPNRIITFDLGVADILHKVGISITGTPQGTLPEYLSWLNDTETYVNVGSMKDPNFEKISETKPELIIISGRVANKYMEFSEIAPTLLITIPGNDYLTETRANIDIFKSIFPEKANELEIALMEIETDIAQLKQKVLEKNINALVILTNDGRISAYGIGSRYGIIYNDFGFKPVDSTLNASTHGQSITFEYIKEKDPDYIFIIDRSAAIGVNKGGAQELLNNELVNSTKAAINKHIIYLDPAIWYLANGGLDASKKMVAEVYSAL